MPGLSNNTDLVVSRKKKPEHVFKLVLLVNTSY